jgi:hypothetical protein
MSRQAVFDHLAGLLRPYAQHHIIKADTPTHLYLEEHVSSAKPQMFAAAQEKASYVSFHLFPVYTKPALLDELSPELRARMQGKSCFNFKSVEQIPTDELKALLAAAHESLSG